MRHEPEIAVDGPDSAQGTYIAHPKKDKLKSYIYNRI